MVLNATDNTIDSNQWDPKFATEKLLDDYKHSIYQVPALRKIVAKLEADGIAISSTKQLLEFYYASILVVRIPAKGSYLQIEEQVGQLYDAIRYRCDASYERKKSARLLLNAERMQQYLNSAFDHFAHHLDQPFDFIKEALRYNSIPTDFGGHIVNLILSLYHDVHDERERPLPDDLLRYLSSPIACCLMLAAAREDMQGGYKTLLRHVFAKPLEEAFFEFRNLWVRCAFRQAGVVCCNASRSHDKGHQAASGKIISRGAYIPPRSAKPLDTFQDWMEDIEKHLEDLNGRVHSAGDHAAGEGPHMAERDLVSKLHQTQSVQFYRPFSDPRFTPRLVSNATCFACIRNVPEHVLPCGHALCRPCIQSFGKPVGGSRLTNSGVFELNFCPLLHASGKSWEGQPVRIRFKPKDAGVRVLCLDG